MKVAERHEHEQFDTNDNSDNARKTLDVGHGRREVESQQQLIAHTFPQWEQNLRQIIDVDSTLSTDVDATAKRALALLPQMEEYHRREGMSTSLVERTRTRIDYKPFDIDQRPGKEVAVAFAPGGVHSIHFHPTNWDVKKAANASVFLDHRNQ